MVVGHPSGRALDASSSGIVIADATVRGFPLTYVNAAFEKLTGYAAADCIGRNCRFLQGEDTDPAAIVEFALALREGRESHGTLLNYRADGSRFYNELRMAPIRDDSGQVVQIIGVQNDVTDIVRARAALQGERDHARRSLQRASRVIARQDQELSELRALQEALTPAEPPTRPGISLSSCFLPAEDGVAGDFYLVAGGPRGSTVIVVGDVMGHGLHAARRATFVRTAIATFSHFTDDPLRLLEMANHSLIERIGTSAEFVTAVCATYWPTSGVLRWATAGHPPPLSLDTGQAVDGSPRIGVPLGIEIDLGGAVAETTLPPGSGVLLYTDGLPEAHRSLGPRAETPRLGDERVHELLLEQRGRDADAVIEALRAAVIEHTGGQPADDLCLVALRTVTSSPVAG